MERKMIENEVRDDERAYYSSKDCDFNNIVVYGPADGESAWKESRNIKVTNSELKLRYPFWHNNRLEVKHCNFADTCRAPFWYTKNVRAESITMKGVKAFRECENVRILNSDIDSEEVFWRVNNIQIVDSKINGFYAFFQSKDIKIRNVDFSGKYSFQYVENIEIADCNLDTKDAFWHSKNVTVKNSMVKGEYLGWYSENLTLIDCTIIGTQPLCYAKGLQLINCKMIDCDLSFEYSEVNGLIIGEVKSIKNPLKGKLVVEHCQEYIKDEFDRSENSFELVEVN